ISDIGLLAVFGQSYAPWNASLFYSAQPDLAMIREVTVRKIKMMDDLVARAATEQGLAITGKGQAIKGLIHLSARNDLWRPYIQNDHFILAIARMKDCGVFPAGMNR